MIIKSRCGTEQIFEYDVHKLDDIAVVRQRISEAMGAEEYPVDRLRLFFNGRELV